MNDWEAKAALWMQSNPEAMALFERFTLEAGARGRRFGMKLVAERVRWECSIAKDGEWKINNSYTAAIARALIRKHPHLAKLIETRETDSEAAQRAAPAAEGATR